MNKNQLVLYLKKFQAFNKKLKQIPLIVIGILYILLRYDIIPEAVSNTALSYLDDVVICIFLILFNSLYKLYNLDNYKEEGIKQINIENRHDNNVYSELNLNIKSRLHKTKGEQPKEVSDIKEEVDEFASFITPIDESLDEEIERALSNANISKSDLE